MIIFDLDVVILYEYRFTSDMDKIGTLMAGIFSSDRNSTFSNFWTRVCTPSILGRFSNRFTCSSYSNNNYSLFSIIF